jgi:hypothetical protein
MRPALYCLVVALVTACAKHHVGGTVTTIPSGSDIVSIKFTADDTAFGWWASDTVAESVLMFTKGANSTNDSIVYNLCAASSMGTFDPTGPYFSIQVNISPKVPLVAGRYVFTAADHPYGYASFGSGYYSALVSDTVDVAVSGGFASGSFSATFGHPYTGDTTRVLHITNGQFNHLPVF